MYYRGHRYREQYLLEYAKRLSGYSVCTYLQYML
jgi:hypothetical protein